METAGNIPGLIKGLLHPWHSVTATAYAASANPKEAPDPDVPSGAFGAFRWLTWASHCGYTLWIFAKGAIYNLGQPTLGGQLKQLISIN